MNQKTKLTVYLDSKLVEALESAATGKRRGGQGGASGIIERALRSALEEKNKPETEANGIESVLPEIRATLDKQPVEAPGPAPWEAPSQLLHELLDRILESGDNSAIRAISANVEHFARGIEIHEKQHALLEKLEAHLRKIEELQARIDRLEGRGGGSSPGGHGNPSGIEGVDLSKERGA